MRTKQPRQPQVWLPMINTVITIITILLGSFTCTPLHAQRETRLERVAAHLGDRDADEEGLLPEDQQEEQLQQQQGQQQQKDQEEDPVAEKEEEKKSEPVLAINGDVRAEWQYITEYGVSSPTFKEEFGPFTPGQGPKHPCNETIRPSNPNCGNPRTCRGPLSANDFDIDLNLYFEFRTPCCWALAHIEFDNDGGVRGIGTRKICGRNNCKKGNKKGCENCCTTPADGGPLDCCNRVDYDPCSLIDCQAPYGSGDFEAIALRKAFFGYNICTRGKTRLDIEVGRRRLFDVFDSRIQFLSQFDGVTLRYVSQLDQTDFYWNMAAFVVNERINHFGWATEVGFLNIQDSGFDAKYSFIDWFKHGKAECCIPGTDGWRFMNSQVTAAYRFNKDYFPVRVKFYGAALYNHAAEERFYTNCKKYPWGGYLGILIGEVVEAGDWSIDMNVQYVGAQAVADVDLTGMGRGNIRNETLTMAAGLRHCTPEERRYATQNARGNTNYKGIKIEGLYAITDYLSIDAQFLHSEAATKKVGGRHIYNKFKIEGIYAF